MPDNWESIERKHLRALQSIARTGTFWAAAEELNASLSSISDHLRELEALVGERLVERSRGRRSVELTDAGRLLLGHAESIESRVLAAEADFRAYKAGGSGPLRVGIYQSVANKILPEVMLRFRAAWPDIDIQVTEGTHDVELVDAVERGALDVTFAIQPLPDGPFETRELMRDPHVLIVAAGAVAAWKRPRVTSLNDAPMVGYDHGKHLSIAEDYLLGLGVRPRWVLRSNDNGTVQAMVAAGLGVALAPLLAVDESDPKIRIMQLVEQVPPRVLIVVWHRDRYRPPPTVAFVETVVAVAAEIERRNTGLLARLASSGVHTRR